MFVTFTAYTNIQYCVFYCILQGIVVGCGIVCLRWSSRHIFVVLSPHENPLLLCERADIVRGGWKYHSVQGIVIIVFS